MMARLPGSAALVALTALVALGLAGVLGAAGARGERTQHGNLIVSLNGGLSPLVLPREYQAPVAIHLEGGLRTADGKLLPRVTRMELGLPGQGRVSTLGLPSCALRKLRYARSAEALEACGPALVGHGRLEAQIQIPSQGPFRTTARLLAFNGRLHGRRAILVHAFATDPPIVAVIPFFFRRGEGRFDTALVANLSASLGPLPRFAHFAITLGRRYSFRGRSRSYLTASCPIPRNLTAGFFSFARSTYTVAGKGRVGTAITRSCRAR